MAEPTDTTASDLDILRCNYGPQGWFFTSCWAAAGSGPDRRLLIAQRRGIVLSAFTPEALSAKIQHEPMST